MKKKLAKRGRPPKTDKERKDSELRIRLTAEQRNALDKAAGLLDTSTWARMELLSLAIEES